MSSLPEALRLVEQIKAEAFRLGFSLVGVTSTNSPAHYWVYEHWLEDGCNAEMAYLSNTRHREMRRNPAALLEGAKSIIVLGWPYVLTDARLNQAKGLVAGYALQQDYHVQLPILMENLVAYIKSSTPCPFEAKCFTDSAPLLERDLGLRAGLGWIGKNSCLISPAKGSAFLLAEILLTLDLPGSQPFLPDRCGTCHRCVDACPTGCIRSDRTLDAGRCISYLTIENKQGIPPDLRYRVGNWVFGCDICQSVCPWNAGQSRQSPPEESALPSEEMIADLNLSEVEFKERYRGSPLLRARQHGYQRNLIVALANLCEAKATQVFERLLAKETNPDQVELLRWALEQLSQD